MFQLIITFLVFFMPQVNLGFVEEWYVLYKTEHVIEEACDAITECRVNDGIMTCWSVDSNNKVRGYDLPFAIPTKAKLDKDVCPVLQRRKV